MTIHLDLNDPYCQEFNEAIASILVEIAQRQQQQEIRPAQAGSQLKEEAEEASTDEDSQL